MNQGIFTLPFVALFFRLRNNTKKDNGIIQRVLANFTATAVCSAASPYAAPAPTTDDVS